MEQQNRIKVACQICKAEFTVNERHVGRLAQCPTCGGNLFVVSDDKAKAAPNN